MIEKQLEKLEEKIDKLAEKLHSIDITLERLTATVEIHEKRSTTAEATLATYKEELSKVSSDTKVINLTYKICVIIATGILSTLVALKQLGLF